MRTWIVLATLTACGTPAPQAPEAPPPAAAEASVDAAAVAAVAKKLRANPADKDAILSDAGMTEDELRAALFDIARSPGLTKVYEAQSQLIPGVAQRHRPKVRPARSPDR